ncbi:hypothetical protein [Sinorhizobium alkalisoli]|uniref:hypothetical protein n=1 Tax=Sinorhizobium alkalisoli TaxID=1752398 RepID=UPI0009F560E6|nr:hypothetical protein [Sinorhizobium alkalisoli]MCA1491348.1 hypothetical protein [Ensifer sp. NBAIM29]MCG5481116.1 hypothetical protein [Sinorhizobium alkalisoli]QFI70356.1 hypothetical protein EKH55_5482 [Sinorhizobium alkalisoli]
MDASRNDLALIEVMRRYFKAKDEANALKSRLEAARNESGDEIGRFYDLRSNALHAQDILTWHRLRKEMERLMSHAALWARGGNIEGCDAAQEEEASGTAHLLGIHAVAE